MRGLCLIIIATAALAQTVDVGTGSPTSAIQARFVNAFYRNGFFTLVTLPPLGDVKTFGGTGLVQEFADPQKNKYALILPNVAVGPKQDAIDIFQLTPGLYSYYSSVGPSTAGFPSIDAIPCPPMTSVSTTCQYELFTKNYALFVFPGSNFATRDPFFTKWTSLGGIASLGPAETAEQMLTSASGVTATEQTFDRGAIFNITSGNSNGRIVAIGPVVYPLYASSGSYSGFLGFPTADEMLLPNGNKRQTFEGGAIEYDSSGVPVLRFPVSSISIAPSSKLTLKLGDSVTLTATLFDPNGNPLSGRAISWSTSNSRIVSIQPSGASVTIQAVGGGSANITATSEGKLSPAVTVFVTAPCCDIGQGAPTSAVQQAFQDAVARNRLQLQTPAPTPVLRSGNGYVQNAQDTQGTPYLIAVADHASAGYVSFGALLLKYQQLGGPAGSLGYPAADPTPGGTQLFNNSALGGSPPRLVSGSFLARWTALGYETGAAGAPVSDVSSIVTFRGASGQVQAFAKGSLLSALTGPQTGKVYFVSGVALASYNQAGGPGGQLGLPTDDEFSASGKRRQDFEGGFIDYTAGDAVAQVHAAARVPVITASPNTVIAGTHVRLAFGGFNPGDTVRVSVSGQQDFSIQTDNGAYTWDTVVSSSAKTGVVSIHAVNANATVSADGSFTVRALTEVRFQIVKISGDGQTGLPAAVLPQALKIAVQDETGNPVAGVPVSFASSPGAQIVSASAATDASGGAQAVLRLQAGDGIALATAQAGSQVVTFSAQAAHSSLSGFPSFTQPADGAALLTPLAAVIRYYQNRGLLPTPNGLADPQSLNQFLKTACAVDSKGAQICDGFIGPFVNLWRAGGFAGNALDVSVEAPDVGHIRDLLALGAPVIVVLCGFGGAGGFACQPTGAHYVVATGVAPDGSVTIMDPDPAGFGTLQGTIAAAIRLIPRVPASAGFLVTGAPGFDVVSAAGPCGVNLDLPGQFRFRFCDGTLDLYELDVSADSSSGVTLTDLGNPGNRVSLTGSTPAAYKIVRSGGTWTASAQQLNFTAAGVVNAASFTPDIAVGGLFAVFGSGLTAKNSTTAILIGGIAAPVVATTPFQIAAQVPPSLTPGAYTMRIAAPYGTLEQQVNIKDIAPAVFLISGGGGAILNQDGTLNTPDNPVQRRAAVMIFCTGLGAAGTPVSVVIGGSELNPAYAGIAPGFIGLNQVNAIIPRDLAPGSSLPLFLKQGGVTSNTAPISIQ